MKRIKKLTDVKIIISVFVLLGIMVWMICGYDHIQTIGEAIYLACLFGLIYAGTLYGFILMRQSKSEEVIFVCIFAALSILARVAMLDYNSADYDSFLAGWVDVFRKGGFRMLGENVGDYNLLYQYTLLTISMSPLYDLYLIKTFTILFDYLLALSMMRATGVFCGKQAELPVFLIMLVLPTTLIEGAFWGQCDSVYVFFVVMALCDLKTGHPWRSASFLALAFAFKLQTIFVFPVVLLALIHKEYEPKHALAFLGTYLLTMVPALIAGRSFFDAISVYASQAMGQYYHRLTYNAPNLYIFFPMLEFASAQEYTWMRFIKGLNNNTTNPYLTMDLFPMLQKAALYACIILVFIAVVYWILHLKEITPDMTLKFALFFAIFLPFVMPKMHDRYFYIADILSILYAFKYSQRKYIPFLVIGASFMSYMVFLTRQRPMDERVLALMMFGALVRVTMDLIGEMRINRRKFRGASAC